MVTLFETYVEPSQKLEEVIDSLVRVMVWQHDGKTFSQVGPRMMSIPLTLPSKPSTDPPTKIIEQAVRNYTCDVRESIEEALGKELIRMGALRKKGSKTREQTAKRIELYERFLSEIEERIVLRSIEGYGKQKHHMLITPPFAKGRYLERHLGTLFQINEVTAHRNLAKIALRHPFGVLTEHDGVLVPTGERMPLGTMMHLPFLAIDFETMNYKDVRLDRSHYEMTRSELEAAYRAEASLYGIDVDERQTPYLDEVDYRQAIIALREEHKNEQMTAAILSIVGTHTYGPITRFDEGTDHILVTDTKTGKPVDNPLHLVESQEDLKEATEDWCNAAPLFGAGGHNTPTFDFGQSKRLMGGLAIGYHKKDPKERGRIPGGFRTFNTIPGLQVIDTLGYASNCMRLGVKKLDVVNRVLTGTTAQKTLSHDELEEASQRAMKGDREAAHTCNYYLVQDGMNTSRMLQAVIPEHEVLIRAFGNDCLDLDLAGKSSQVAKYWSNRLYRLRGVTPQQSISRLNATLETFVDEEDNYTIDRMGNMIEKEPKKPKKRTILFEDFDGTDYFLYHHLHKTALTGMADDVHSIELFPLARAFEPLLSLDPDVKAAYDFVRTTPDAHTKERVLRYLEALAWYPYFEILRSTERKSLPGRFGSVLALPWQGHEQQRYLARLSEVAEELEPLSDGFINRKAGRIIYKGDRLANRVGVYLGRGRALSGTQGRFGTEIDGVMNLLGIAPPQSNQGTFNAFEKRVRQEFFERTLLGNPDEAVDMARTQKARYLAGKVPDEELAYEQKAGKNYTDYSIRATQRFVQELRAQRAMRGELVRWWLTPSELEGKMFGQEGSISTPVMWLTGFGTNWL